MRASTFIFTGPRVSSNVFKSSTQFGSTSTIIPYQIQQLHTSLNQSPRSPRSRFPVVSQAGSSNASPSFRNQYGSIRNHGHSATSTTSEPIEPIPEISEENTYDIVIIGGANAGLALGCALLSQPTISTTTKIVLIEGSSLDKTRNWSGKGDWENRISSLTWENISWLESIGVWKHIEESRSCPVEEMIIWANPSPDSFPTIHFPPLGHPMARMTENMNLQKALLKRIEEIGNNIITIKENSRVNEMRLGDGERWVGLKIGDEWIKGSLVIGADGPNSPVRLFSKIETYGHAYNTHAVVATLNHSPSPLYSNTTAFQRFLPTGPIAFLPLNETTSTMVWSTLPLHAKALKNLNQEALTILINCGYSLPESSLNILTNKMIERDQQNNPLSAEEINNLLSEIIEIPNNDISSEQPILPPRITSIEKKSVAGFPLRLSHANEYIGKRTVLVGDAAHTIHPLAGQGLNQGLNDVQSLSKILENSKILGGDLGSITNLKEYSKERYPLNHLILSTTDKLHYIFRARNPIINWFRGTGLDIINELNPLKKLLMGGAGAGAGAAPQLSNGVKRDNSKKETGWQSMTANSLDNWFTIKNVSKMAGGVAVGLLREGARRAAGSLQKK
ncbi:ubiquinone biosynthesis monooxygenase COQ6 [Kwoniella dendrophila CBS 6074]|uniref:Ubiquinone biosynthesis monooxygenase COQ6, mitochondrial n=1 Tax=Kwoniella dendrophila CBS 6074 TaxID=1295534 RepID=A0AAX4K3C7_9TREE